AFQDNSNGGWTIYNTSALPKPQRLGGAKIAIVVSSSNSAPWKGDFYIECHGNTIEEGMMDRAEFEFVEWQTYSRDNIIDDTHISHKEDSQVE
ncbi:hypothetical protein ACFLVI_04345, partial [Chloroflexota bacterium]